MGGKLAGLYQGLSNIAAAASRIQQEKTLKAERDAEKKQALMILLAQNGIPTTVRPVVGQQDVAFGKAPKGFEGIEAPQSQPEGFQPISPKGAGLVQQWENLPKPDVQPQAKEYGQAPIPGERRQFSLDEALGMLTRNKQEEVEYTRGEAARKAKLEAAAAAAAATQQTFENNNTTTDNTLAQDKFDYEKEQKLAAIKALPEQEKKELAKKIAEEYRGLTIDKNKMKYAHDLSVEKDKLNKDGKDSYTIKYGNLSGQSVQKLQGAIVVMKALDKVNSEIEVLTSATGFGNRLGNAIDVAKGGEGSAAAQALMNYLLSVIASADVGKAWTEKELKVMEYQVPVVGDFTGDNDAQALAKLRFLDDRAINMMRSVLTTEIAQGKKINMDLIRKEIGPKYAASIEDIVSQSPASNAPTGQDNSTLGIFQKMRSGR